ncbi:MAG: DUF1902 domain-containing protein [Firmicutes bacterium]|nr:DUF1902 domain-containing protein [Bacillota bacterium]
MQYNVNLAWDKEADVWIATSDDIPGLVLESGSFDALVERVRSAAAELISLNHMPEVTSIQYNPQCFQREYA